MLFKFNTSLKMESTTIKQSLQTDELPKKGKYI